MTYQVIEDNAGGMYLFFFDDNENAILAIENIEHVKPGDLGNVTFSECRHWDSQLEKPQEIYNGITLFSFGWEIVADDNGIYPDRMGRAAQLVYGANDD